MPTGRLHGSVVVKSNRDSRRWRQLDGKDARRSRRRMWEWRGHRMVVLSVFKHRDQDVCHVLGLTKVGFYVDGKQLIRQ